MQETQIYMTFDTVSYARPNEFAGLVDELFIEKRAERKQPCFPGKQAAKRTGIAPCPAG